MEFFVFVAIYELPHHHLAIYISRNFKSRKESALRED